ncbi:hypothetical protein [Methanobrevibacter sp.]
MPRPSRIETSDHYEEIVERLSLGESTRSISKWLKEDFGESISHVALAKYKSKHIKMEDKVEAELNKRAKKRNKKINKIVQNKTDVKESIEKNTQSIVKNNADTKEAINENIKTVSETIADNMQGVAKVAAQFPQKFQEACEDAKDESNTNVTSKDVARLALDANKLYNDYFKQDGNIEITEGFEELANAIHKSRQAIEKAKKL